MPNPSVTNVFVNGTANDAGGVNTNFSDLISALTDGTKDLTMMTGTFTTVIGTTATFTSITATNLLSTLLPTNATYDLGDATHNFKALFLDNGATHGGRVNFNAGATSYLGSSADGLSLAFGGFTELTTIGAMLFYDSTGTNYYSINNTASPAFDLMFRYNGTNLMMLDNSALALSGENTIGLSNFNYLGLGTNLSEANAPQSKTLYANSMCKAWGSITSTGSGTSLTRTSAFNVDTVAYQETDNTIDITFHRSMATGNYVVVAQMGTPVTVFVTTLSKSTTTLRLYCIDSAGAVFDFNSSSGRICDFIVMGVD